MLGRAVHEMLLETVGDKAGDSDGEGLRVTARTVPLTELVWVVEVDAEGQGVTDAVRLEEALASDAV